MDNKKSLNKYLPEEKSARKKLITELTLFTGTALLAGSLIVYGIELCDNKINHCNEVCLLTKMGSVKHQINKIKQENSDIIPIYNSSVIINVETGEIFDLDDNKNVNSFYQISSSDKEIKLFDKETRKIKILELK